MGSGENFWFSFHRDLVGERPITVRAFVEACLKVVRCTWLSGAKGMNQTTCRQILRGWTKMLYLVTKASEKNIIVFNYYFVWIKCHWHVLDWQPIVLYSLQISYFTQWPHQCQALAGAQSSRLYIFCPLLALPTSQLEKIRVVAVFLMQMPAHCREARLPQAQSTDHWIPVRW